MSSVALYPQPETGIDARMAGRLVLCGSMTFLPEMARLRHLLAQRGVAAVIPEDVDGSFLQASQEAYLDSKRQASLTHIRKIQHPRTYGILVANFDKHGVAGYIGPNTFAEIAIAFAAGRSLFVLNGVPSNYEDELTAWRTRDVAGDLNVIVQEYPETWRRRQSQLLLPDF